jgi:hypothetical protein
MSAAALVTRAVPVQIHDGKPAFVTKLPERYP